ncbi:MAG: error-prone DNA polymerase [Chloroflexi bacterium]|nr:error-prone DNA polymerase [Chloroflexota bacterium]
MTDSDYVELRAHSSYSLLRGTASPGALLTEACRLGMAGLALTDHNNVYGAVEFQRTGQALGIQTILGAELTLEHDLALPLLVANETGWKNLCWLITQAQHQAPKGEGLLRFEQLEGRTDGLIALSGGCEGEIARCLETGGVEAGGQAAGRYVAMFGRDRFWIELHHHRRPYDDQRMAALVGLADSLKLGYVATNHVHYLKPEDKPLSDVVTAIRHNRSLDNVQSHLFPNGQYYLKSLAAIQELFRRYPRALENTSLIAEQCPYQLPSRLQELPRYPVPAGMTAQAYLSRMCCHSERYKPYMESRLQHELNIIEATGLANYFLVVWDIVRFAWKNGIRCQGRGSAANSLVAYLLMIAPVDPIEHQLVFERFLSPERQMAPDIDMDFDADRREEVIQYLYDKYGRTHAAMACTFVTYRHRSVIRDVAKAWGLAPSSLPFLKDQWEVRTAAANKLPPRTANDGSALLDKRSSKQEMKGNPQPHLEPFFHICDRLLGNVRHIGIHNGGEIIADVPLSRRLPTEPATMPDRTVVQWDKESLEDAGIIKIDVLGLKMLSAITEMVERTGVDADMIPFEDPRVYQMITQAKTFGVFQCESRAQMNTLPRLKPTRFLDLVIAISLIRPGPIMGNMVHPYLRRRRGAEAVSYLDGRLKSGLEETLGVILWQEQVLKVAHDIGGFTHGQGELLRRALGSKHSFQLLDQLETIFIKGAIKNGVAEGTAQAIFGQLRGFGAYSFAKSHAASFAVLTYRSAWFKYHYPAVFYAAILNHQPMGFWAPSTLVYDAMRQGIAVLPPDINRSGADCTVEDDGIRIGLQYIKGIKNRRLNQLLEIRAQRPFADLQDFMRRVKLPLRLVERIIQSGAMDSWHSSRHQLLWDAGILHQAKGNLPMDTPSIQLPVPTPMERLNMELAATGLSTQHHPMQYYRAFCLERRILHSKQILRARENAVVQTAGLVVIIQAPETAKEIRFITLEDEYELINIVVFPNLYYQARRTIRNERFLWVTGTVERDETVTTIRASAVRPLPNHASTSERIGSLQGRKVRSTSFEQEI